MPPSREFCPQAGKGGSTAGVAAQGFGGAPLPKKAKPSTKGKGKKGGRKKGATHSITEDQAIKRAVELAEGGKARPVSEDEAARGRLDYVQVKDWGSGSRENMGNLRVASTASTAVDPRAPLYEQLARHLALCQMRGDLNPPGDQPPLPPFEHWVFRRRHYVQYITDQLAVHRALEAAIVFALRPPGSNRDHSEEPPLLSTMRESPGMDPRAYGSSPSPQHAALAQFTPFSGRYARAGALLSDLDSIMSHSPITPEDGPAVLESGPHVKQYVQQLMALGSAAQDGERADQARDAARMQLLAHVYSNYVAHLTTGTRIGAAATERLNLFPISATKFYDTYPDSMKDPLRHFLTDINQVGRLVSSEAKEQMLEELPSAMINTSQVLIALAKK
eukprot:CAMPEP_0206143040 /NCGR_PEP_ID=MMETSP1473-20131121/19110_1 /ASSEMBLY_ACC=CAM_ASM_001109 /TAXON_ID=1461547 /ORGANISM="Stichococcus sp, Strain RCC1054" /LENGTH=389 /DNA_ID=CAMNT_0053538273 /DNA_START=273 /DNA_END=1443 /DNA_ORIENTATION=+